MLRSRYIGVVAAFLALLLACREGAIDAPSVGRGVEPSPALIAIPTPDLSRAEATAREQIMSLRAALDALDKAVEPAASARAYGDLGSAYLVYDFLDAARASFANARALAGDDFRWTYLLGYVHQLEGRLDQALPLLEQVASHQPDFIPALLRLGRAHLDRGDLDAAASRFQRALAAEPGVAAGLEGLGKVATARGEIDSAIDLLEQALARAPKANSLNYALAQLYRKQGNLEQAQTYLAARGDVAVRIADPLLNPLGALGQGVQLHLMHAAEAMEDADFEAAAGAYRRALAVDETSFTASRGLSYAVEKLGDLEGAIEHLTAALPHIDPEDPVRAGAQRAEALRILGGLQALAGRDTEAIEHFEAALASSAGDHAELAAVRLKLANALARQRRYDQALTRYDEVLSTALDAATQAAVLERRATALVNVGRGDDALADFKRAITLTPDDAGLRMRFADALATLGDAQGADRARDEAVTVGGDGESRARLLAETGRRLQSQGQFEQAVDHFDASLALDAEQPVVRHQLATVLGHLGYFEDALREFRAVVDAAPRHAAARRGEITVLLLTERFGGARVRLQEALQIFPLDAGLALVQARLLASCPDPTVRDGALALEIVSRLHRVHDVLPVRETLAMALAATGRFDEAAALQRTLLAEAEQAADPRRVEALRDRLVRFDRREAWAAPSGEEIVAATRAVGEHHSPKGT